MGRDSTIWFVDVALLARPARNPESEQGIFSISVKICKYLTFTTTIETQMERWKEREESTSIATRTSTKDLRKDGRLRSDIVSFRLLPITSMWTYL